MLHALHVLLHFIQDSYIIQRRVKSGLAALIKVGFKLILYLILRLPGWDFFNTFRAHICIYVYIRERSIK